MNDLERIVAHQSVKEIDACLKATNTDNSEDLQLYLSDNMFVGESLSEISHEEAQTLSTDCAVQFHSLVMQLQKTRNILAALLTNHKG